MTETKLTPVFPAAQTAGATFIEQGGWQLPERFSDDEAAAAATGVALVDLSGCGKIVVQGREGATAVAALGLEAPAAIGAATSVDGVEVYRLRADQLFVSTPPGEERRVLTALTEGATDAGVFVTVTDVTHGRAQFRLIGPNSRALLARLCGLDFDPAIFPDQTVKQTGVAKTTQLVIHHDLAGGQTLSYSLIGARSLGAYLWETILHAGHDLGARPAGWDTYAALAG